MNFYKCLKLFEIINADFNSRYSRAEFSYRMILKKYFNNLIMNFNLNYSLFFYKNNFKVSPKISYL